MGLALKGGTSLQTEIYVQMLKQLTDNPSPSSQRLGWQLLTLLLQCFPPESTVENFVANFLRVSSVHPQLYLKLCYATIRRGPRRSVPVDAELPDLLTAVETATKQLQGGAPPPLPRDTSSSMTAGQAVSGKL